MSIKLNSFFSSTHNESLLINDIEFIRHSEIMHYAGKGCLGFHFQFVQIEGGNSMHQPPLTEVRQTSISFFSFTYFNMNPYSLLLYVR